MKKDSRVHLKENRKRSLIKAITYRIIILVLDFTVIFILTKKIEIALGFMIISNIYTSIVYYFHERIWDRINWGKRTG
jgi:adenylylsulfate kinase